MNATSIFKKVELIANVAIIIVAVLFSVVLVKSYLFTNSSPSNTNLETNNNEIHAGQVVALPDVDWTKNGRTLLLALSTTCHFCTQSGPFYQRLVKEHGDTQLIALVPQSDDEGRQYLKKLGVEINEVKQVSMSELGLSGTPTLVLVDSSGKVVNVWVGALPPDQENEVLNQVRSERASR
jgi:thioredoxin-related protein